jgi:deoxyhypusine synthase
MTASTWALQMYFHNYKRPEFFCDIVDDIRRINDIAVRAPGTGMIILGGGLVKHHTCNANLMRNGADFSVFINTGHEFDGSDSGASPDEAVRCANTHTHTRMHTHTPAHYPVPFQLSFHSFIPYLLLFI